VDQARHLLPVVTDHRVLELLEEGQVPFVLAEEPVQPLLDGLVGRDRPAQQAKEESCDEKREPAACRPGSAGAKLPHRYGP
jgi:hypothetical protein